MLHNIAEKGEGEHGVKQKHKFRWRPTNHQVIQAIKVATTLIAVLLTSIGIRALFDGGYEREGIVILVLLLLILIRIGYRYDWTGFGEVTRTKSETQEEVQPRKTLWDWLGLLIVPLVLTIGGFLFAWSQDNRQQEIEAQRANSEQEIEEQRAQDAALQAYFDQMSQLMLEGDLRSSSEESSEEARTLARARTQTILTQLDGRRKGSVVQFLSEASLINKERPVVSLSQVDLRGANLTNLNVKGADLSDADLSEANLSGASLPEADLNSANLPKADVGGAVLSDADLSGAELNDANLRGTLLSGADLSGAELIKADLSDGTLSDADLSGAYLFDADLSSADLSGADLSSAYLSGAAGVTEEQLEKQAKTLEGATMPNGSIHN